MPNVVTFEDLSKTLVEEKIIKALNKLCYTDDFLYAFDLPSIDPISDLVWNRIWFEWATAEGNGWGRPEDYKLFLCFMLALNETGDL